MILDDIAPLLSKSTIPASTQIFVSRLVPRHYSEQYTLKRGAINLFQNYVDRNAAIKGEAVSSLDKNFRVIGCVDGTLIRIMKPPSDHAAYFSRKGYFSLNAMIICDNEMRIGAVDACRPGSCHDSFVWKMSDGKRYFSTMHSEGVRNFWLLGDSGYPQKPYLITPYKNPLFGTAQHTFNLRHASARNIVERSIGVLKSRFRCLQSVLSYVPSKAVSIINVCCVLHNICIHYNIALDEEIIVSSAEDDLETAEQDEYDNSAVTTRDNIAYSLNLSNEI